MVSKNFYWSVVFILFFANSVFCDPRNLHGKCAIRINELFLGREETSYLELAKICPQSQLFHANNKLTGFAVIVLKAVKQNLVCKFSKKLSRELLQDPTEEQEFADRSLASARNLDRSRNVLVSTLQSNANNEPQIVNLPAINNDFEIQTNAKLFYALRVPALLHTLKGFTVVLVLQMDSLRMKNRLPCKINKQLERQDIFDIKNNLHDFVILFGSNDEGSTEIVTEILRPGTDIGNYIVPVITQNVEKKGFSKCDNIISPTSPSEYKRAVLTEGKPNQCPLRNKAINKLAFVFPFSFQGSPFDKSAKKLIINLVKSLEYYKNDRNIFSKQPKAIAASLLNIAEITITRFEKQLEDKTLTNPKEKRKGHAKVLNQIDDKKREHLYQSIASFYAANKVATIPEIHSKFLRRVKHDQNVELEQSGPPLAQDVSTESFYCGLGTFRKLLKLEGYKFGKIALRDSVIFEPTKVLWRRKYLDRMKRNRETNEFNVLYIDETWIDPHMRVTKGIVKKCYNDFNERRSFTFKKHKVSRGGRILVMAAGGRSGFINPSNLVWKISPKQSKNQDYHDNMNREQFEKWFVELMDTVEKEESKKYLFVIDNAPYHTSLSSPRSDANKAEMIQFLKKEHDESGLELPSNYERLLYIELKQLVKEVKEATPRYKLDDLARSRGHEIVGIPPYNCNKGVLNSDLNPIEEVWKDVKALVRRQNHDQDINSQVIIAKNALNTYSVDMWNKHVDHIERLEHEYYVGDQAFDNLLNNNKDLRSETNLLIDNANEDANDNDDCDTDTDHDEQQPGQSA